MINLIPIGRVISAIAVLYGAIACGFLWISYNNTTSFLKAVMISFGGSTALNIGLLFILYFGWKKIWAAFPFLNHLLFPNLNGKWDMVIYWQSGDKSGTSIGVAHIKQNFLKIGMEVGATDSDSETLMADPRKDPESGRAILYYVYRVVPKKNNGDNNHSYEGAAILKLDNENNTKLSGNYFTSRMTVGRFELQKKNS